MWPASVSATTPKHPGAPDAIPLWASPHISSSSAEAYSRSISFYFSGGVKRPCRSRLAVRRGIDRLSPLKTVALLIAYVAVAACAFGGSTWAESLPNNCIAFASFSMQ